MVSTHIDDYILNKDSAIWIARLGNGQSVFMDDGRPGETPSSAWIRLRDYLFESQTQLVGLELAFRDHYESPLPNGALAYFFRHNAIGQMGEDTTFSFFLIGYVLTDNPEKVIVEKWKVPELTFFSREERLISNEKEVGGSIIWNR